MGAVVPGQGAVDQEAGAGRVAEGLVPQGRLHLHLDLFSVSGKFRSRSGYGSAM